MRYGGHKVLVVLAWLALATSASGQQPSVDPVASAMDRIDAALGASAHAAVTVIEASRHVSAGAEARNSIGTVLVSGMTLGTLFTLVVVPVFYALIAAEHKPAEVFDESTDDRPARGRLTHGALVPEVAVQ